MAVTAVPTRIGPDRRTPFTRPTRPQRTVSIGLRVADAENRETSDAEYGRLIRAVVLAYAYGSITPATLAMRTGTDHQAAAATLDALVRSGALPADMVTGSAF